ncbi:hypothetical protein [Longispora albida]|uniref:hypothetical protein n=1 Tax=Longispora albida TaxID=203523 RepID=UPI00035E994B|nr:hypothetical protein [Longispora albida]
MELFTNTYDPVAANAIRLRPIIFVPGMPSWRSARYSPQHGGYLVPDTVNTAGLRSSLAIADARAEHSGSAGALGARCPERAASARLIALEDLAAAMVAADGGVEGAAFLLGVERDMLVVRLDTLGTRERRHFEQLTTECRRDRGGRVLLLRTRLELASATWCHVS